MTARVSRADIAAAMRQAQEVDEQYDALVEAGKPAPLNAAEDEIEKYVSLLFTSSLFKWEKGSANAFFSGVISSVSVASARAMLDDLEDQDKIVINFSSVGGNAVAGIALANLFSQAKQDIEMNCIGMAYSAASTAFQGASVRRMAPGSMVGIHKAWLMIGMGDADDMRAAARTLDAADARAMELYAEKVGKENMAELKELYDADTALSRDDAIRLGLADEKMSMKEAKAIRAAYEAKSKKDAKQEAKIADAHAAVKEHFDIADPETAPDQQEQPEAAEQVAEQQEEDEGYTALELGIAENDKRAETAW